MVWLLSLALFNLTSPVYFLYSCASWLGGDLDLQLWLDRLPESLTFRHTVINLTKDIWKNHLWLKIMTLAFQAETRHHRNCTDEKAAVQRPLCKVLTSFRFVCFLQKKTLLRRCRRKKNQQETSQVYFKTIYLAMKSTFHTILSHSLSPRPSPP